MTWLTGWTYRKTHTINGSTAGAQINYQVGIKVYKNGTGDGTEVINGTTFGTIHCEGHCKSDFGDIRFTNINCVPLDYWIESQVNDDSAIFWVEVDEIPQSPQTKQICLYYGKLDENTTSNATNTFLAFRDLVDNFYADMGTVNLALYGNGFDPGDYFISPQTVDSVSVDPCIFFRIHGLKKYSVSTSMYFEASLDCANYGICGFDIRNRTSAAPTGWQSSMGYISNTALNKKHIFVLDYCNAGSSPGGLAFFSTWSNPDDIPEGTAANSFSLTSSSRTTLGCSHGGSVSHIRLSAPTNAKVTFYSALYAIANYVSPEPSHGTWGEEETESFEVEPFRDGFESGDFSAWTSTSGSVSIVQSPIYQGSNSCRTAVITGATNVMCLKTMPEVSEIYMRSYVYFQNLPQETSDYVAVGPRFSNNGTALASVIVNGANPNKWGIRRGSNNYWQSTTSAIQTGKWYCVELHLKLDDPNGILRLWLDGVQIVEQTSITGSTLVNEVSENLYLLVTEQSSIVVFHDNIKVSGSYIGPEYFEDCFENGDFSKWTTTSGSPIIQSTITYHGSNAMLSDGANAKSATKTFPAMPVCNARAYYYFSEVPTQSGEKVTVLSNANGADNTKVDVYHDGISPKWRISDNYQNNWAVSKTSVNPNQWYYVEAKIASEGTNTLIVNGAEEASISNGTAASTTAINVGGWEKTGIINVYVGMTKLAPVPIGPEVTEVISKLHVTKELKLDVKYDLFEVTQYDPILKLSEFPRPPENGPDDPITIYGTYGMDVKNDKLLYLSNASLLTDNDVMVFGSIGSFSDFALRKETGGGAFNISHGWKACKSDGDVIAMTPPLIELFFTDPNYKAGIPDYYRDPKIPTYSLGSLPTAVQMVTEAGAHETGHIACVPRETESGTVKDLYLWNGKNWGKNKDNINEPAVPIEKDVSGYFDTLFLFKEDGFSPANLDLGKLAVRTSLTVYGSNAPQLTLDDDNAKIQFSDDCNLYRSVKTVNDLDVTVLETDNSFVCDGFNSDNAVINEDLRIEGELYVDTLKKVNGDPWTFGEGGPVYWADILNKPSTFTPPTITYSMTNFANQSLNTSNNVQFNQVTTSKVYNSSTLILQGTEIWTYGGDLSIRGGYHVIPEGTWGGSYYEGGSVGDFDNRWSSGYMRTVYTEGGGPWDEYDDLAIVQQWGEKQPKVPDIYDPSKKKPEGNDPFVMFRASPSDDYFNLNDLVSFSLGCAKALARKQDETSKILLQLLNDKELLETKCQLMQAQIEKLQNVLSGMN
jgi:hypothetical protein